MRPILLVSIQRLFGFVLFFLLSYSKFYNVSIQRLFGFVFGKSCQRWIETQVSIQRLFGFVRDVEYLYRERTRFQYNDCLGSSKLIPLRYNFSHSFNTTIVWVRPLNFLVIPFFNARFNTTIVWVRHPFNRF